MCNDCIAFREQISCFERTEVSDSGRLQLIGHQRSNSISPIQHSLNASEKSVEICHFSLLGSSPYIGSSNLKENGPKMVCLKIYYFVTFPLAWGVGGVGFVVEE